MRAAELEVFQALRDGPSRVGKLADRLDVSQSWASELVGSLADQHLVERADGIERSDTYEATLLEDLSGRYELEKVLAGKRERFLTELLDGPQTTSELQRAGFPSSTTYDLLGDLRETGVVRETDDGYVLADETLERFLRARERSTPFEAVYEAGDQRVVVTREEDVDGVPTAFSAFTRYGVEYYPTKRYVYQGDGDLEFEDVLVHAVAAAEDRKQLAMAAIFYLQHRSNLESSELWRLARAWDCVERWADVMAYVDRRDVRDGDLFLPWEEFLDLATEYDVYLRGHHPEDSLVRGFEEIGAELAEPIDAFLLGGGNLILRDLKDSTKDIDVVLRDRNAFRLLVTALRALDYEERGELERAYEQMDPSLVLEREGYPRWDVFVEAVAGQLRLTDAMVDRCDRTFEYGNLRVHLLSPVDIFVFKSITEREGDLEDVALLARRTTLDWDRVVDEIERQEAATGQFWSFAVLDTLELLEERYDVVSPVTDRLATYCLEKALLLSLKESKTIEDLRRELDVPDHRIYNALRRLEREDAVAVDRSGQLNEYQLRDGVDPTP